MDTKMLGICHVKKSSKIFVFILALLCWLIGCDKQSDSKEHLQKGVDYLNKGDYEKAKLELKTSSQADKDTAETYYYLALLDEKNRNFKAMKENLVRAIELEPNYVEARIKLGNLYVFLGDVASASQQVETLLKNSSQNKDVKTLQASVLLRQQQQEKALEIINEVLKDDPNNSAGLALKALAYSQKSRNDEALAFIDQAIKADNKNLALYVFKIQLHTNEKNEQAVLADYDSLIKNFPDNKELKIMLVREYARIGKYDEAEKLLRNIVENNQNDVESKLLLLDLLFSKGFFDNEKQLLNQFHQFVDQHKNQPAILFALSNWMAKKRYFSEADQVLSKILERENDTNLAYAAKTLLAKNAHENNELEKADQLVKEILAQNPSYDDAKVLQVKLLMLKNQYDEAIALLNEINWSKPNSDEVEYLFGLATLGKGDSALANKHFAKAWDLNPANLQAFDYIYKRVLEKNDTVAAKNLLEKALKFSPENLALLNQLVKMDLANKDWESAEKAVQAIEMITSPLAKDLARFFQAEILRGQKDYVKAIKIYKELLAKFPENEEALTSLAAAYGNLDQQPEMVSYLNDLIKKNPNNLTAMVVLANLYIDDKKFAESEWLLTKLLKSQPKNVKSYLALAKVKLAQKQPNQVIEVLQQGIKENPTEVSLPLALASFYEDQGDWDAAVAVYENLLQQRPGLTFAINNLASILTDRYDDPEKHTRAVKLAEKFKNAEQANLKDTYAWALVKAGRVQEGLESLKRIVVAAPDVAIFKYHLGYALYKNGEASSAISELKQTVELAKRKNLADIQKRAEILLKDISKR